VKLELHRKISNGNKSSSVTLDVLTDSNEIILMDFPAEDIDRLLRGFVKFMKTYECQFLFDDAFV